MYTKLNFSHASIFCRGIYMSVSKLSICFWKWVISFKWRNKLLIYNINMTGHRKSACCLQLLIFLEIWVIAPFWHWRTQVFAKGCCHHDLEAFCEIGYKSVLLNIIEKNEGYSLSLLFTHLVKGHWRTGNRLLVTWFFWCHMIIYDCFSSIFCIVPKKVLLLKYRKWVSHLENRYQHAKVVENTKINFSISPFCRLLFSRTENFKVFEVAFWHGWLHYEGVRISALKYCQYHTGHLLAFRKRR